MRSAGCSSSSGDFATLDTTSGPWEGRPGSTAAKGAATGRVAAFCGALVVAGVLAAGAFAAEPTKTTFTVTNSPNALTGVCTFDVAIASNATVTEIDYFNADSTFNRIYFHQVEQDTFSANGNSITGEPYVVNVEVLFDSSGNVTHVYGSGVVERIDLPDGTFFLSAGRADFAAHEGVTFLLSPDVGNPGDVAAFCAALS
jgi:hypothetical protein